MVNLMEAVNAMPKMLPGNELASALTILPEYDESIRNKNEAVRLMALSDLYRIYLPSQMSIEIYSKLYLSLLRSLQKKNTTLAIQQRYENNRAIQQQAYNGIMGGSDSYTIIGASGIGKSSAISRAIFLITEKRLIETETPHSKIIPCLMVQCPFDSSVKGLLLEILRKANEELGTTYYQYAIKSRASTVDMLIGMVSTVALNHIGLLIVDEIQNVANSKNGKNLVGMLTQLINNSGISICMVGTPESTMFFEQAMQLARRSLGLQYNRLEFNQYLCSIASMHQIQRVLLGSHFDFSVVCQIAFFLGLTVEELTSPSLKMEQIQKEMDSHYMKDAAPVDWETLDAETAPVLETVVSGIYDGTANENGRPERVSERLVYREMGLRGHQLENMPRCKAIFARHTESYPESWARKIIWAYRQLQAKGVPFYWSDVRVLSGVKKKNFQATIPYLMKHTDADIVNQIIELTENN